ncbi:MAG: glutathione S-transferase [Ilumatobacter sp.]|jgi:glutathione S-transferase|uniref:glutathione S-transferase C-terminal domain-containing protein n=1 Tax=Ilumatobacter sp. TaxID=1967498 RepID=UPI001D7AC3EA|nr:glutathione S-transferase [Ilumatobacter sp.]MBT5276254.1 glutathione S-transferase [Ilumatobacter sp.]MBT5552870.1 glutathione S-transferase [Ilumatobacter sp.]MBT5864433.1 glutathione S-transferase [Ilumatobacter sp.]MDG0977999.1 glutathione S-transferase C-terminal domain-containing protein [Ilumatobacter sp.]
MTYILYGAPVSLYTGKTRSYLRTQGIDFVEMSPGSDRYLNHIVPTVGRWIIPCLETPDGTIIQDGADIIDHFDLGDGSPLRRSSVRPESPTLLAISHLFEIFGGEGLLRPAMHYRWNFDEQNLDFIMSEFALNMPQSLTEEQAQDMFRKSSGRMRKAAVAFGVSAASQPLIETAFEEWLDLFSAHLVEHPYLLGGRPTLGDYGLIAAMWAHLFRDPAPTMLIKQRAPRVGRWVERMTSNEPYLHEYGGTVDPELVDDSRLPETLLAMMRFVAEEYLPEIVAHVAVANDWLAEHPEIEAGTNGLDNPANRGLTGGRDGGGNATFDWRGMQITTGVLPYRFWLMQRLHDDLAATDATQQQRARGAFRAGGVEQILDLRTIRRIERSHHLEVWGPLV